MELMGNMNPKDAYKCGRIIAEARAYRHRKLGDLMRYVGISLLLWPVPAVAWAIVWFLKG